MNDKRIYKILPWLVLLLLATNAGTIISLVSHLKEKTGVSVQENLQEENIPDMQRTRFFTEKLNLDNDQQEKVWELNQGFNRMANRIKAEMDISRQELVTELGKGEPNELALSQLSQDIGNKHTELKQVTIDFYLGIKKICNPEQNENLLKLFQTLIQTDQPSGNRQGSGRGPGHGRRFSNGNEIK